MIASRAMPCAPAHGGAAAAAVAMAMPHDHDHGDHHAAHPATAGDAAADPAPSDNHNAVASCNCGCASLCGAASDVAQVRVTTPERHAVAVSYAWAAQPVADGVQFIDPGIPIRLA